MIKDEGSTFKESLRKDLREMSEHQCHAAQCLCRVLQKQQEMGVAHFLAFLQRLKKGTEELQEFIVKKIVGSLQWRWQKVTWVTFWGH